MKLNYKQVIRILFCSLALIFFGYLIQNDVPKINIWFIGVMINFIDIIFYKMFPSLTYEGFDEENDALIEFMGKRNYVIAIIAFSLLSFLMQLINLLAILTGFYKDRK